MTRDIDVQFIQSYLVQILYYQNSLISYILVSDQMVNLHSHPLEDWLPLGGFGVEVVELDVNNQGELVDQQIRSVDWVQFMEVKHEDWQHQVLRVMEQLQIETLYFNVAFKVLDDFFLVHQLLKDFGLLNLSLGSVLFDFMFDCLRFRG